jgi:hypothetical protein
MQRKPLRLPFSFAPTFNCDAAGVWDASTPHILFPIPEATARKVLPVGEGIQTLLSSLVFGCGRLWFCGSPCMTGRWRLLLDVVSEGADYAHNRQAGMVQFRDTYNNEYEQGSERR